MIQDKSPDYEETWKFLKKQLDEAATVYSCIQQSEQASQLTKEISIATFTTVRNDLLIRGSYLKCYIKYKSSYILSQQYVFSLLFFFSGEEYIRP